MISEKASAPTKAWGRALLSSGTIAVMYCLALLVDPAFKGWVAVHITYSDGSVFLFPTFGYVALGLSLLATTLIRQDGEWFQEIGPALATLALAYGLYGPHCEVDVLVLAAFLCWTWGTCKPSPRRVAALLLVVGLLAEFVPSPFGTPGIRLMF